ncbi:MAG: hypothetical protein A2085_02555 [Gemmatimonadetes bacterium GWC2_71_10]|nr:MAG: hypothetical protein A2085_02555 [Gemmatimonadetes bacterium GWC2_71_10]
MVVALALGERGAARLSQRVRSFDQLLAANLLEAEVRAALAREGVPADAAVLDPVSWVLPDRPLTPEIERVLSAGQLRGADLWHVACALFATPEPADLPFLTLDERQRDVAAKLGFPT